MMVSLFIKDFELGTHVSSKITEMERIVEFCDIVSDVSNDTQLIIIDLDAKKSGDEDFIRQLAEKNKGVQIIGFLKFVQKELHGKYKKAGCSIILPRSSLVKNLSSLLP